MRKLLAWMLAVALLFVGMPSLCEGWDDEEDDFEFFDDDEIEFDIEEEKQTLSALSGYEERFQVIISGDFGYLPVNEGTAASITSYTGEEGELTVPEKLDDLPVISIGNQAFWYNDVVEFVRLPEGITEIGDMAFYMCPNLKEVYLPEGVVSIGTCCFGGCAMLEAVEISSTVETVSDFAFLACASMKEISFSENLKSIGVSAFQMCSSLQKVTIPEGTEIGNDAFTECPAEIVKH